MPSYQTNLFICDECEKCYSTTQPMQAYSETPMLPPPGWNYPDRESWDFLCPECLAKRKSMNVENSPD